MKRKMDLPGRQQARESYGRSRDCLKRRALGAATAAIKEENLACFVTTSDSQV